jgi:hypothetical protein
MKNLIIASLLIASTSAVAAELPLIPQDHRAEIKVLYGIKDSHQVGINAQGYGQPAGVSGAGMQTGSHSDVRVSLDADLYRINEKAKVEFNTSLDSDGGYFTGIGVGLKF